MTGALVVVATPIGNLGDLSDRARDALIVADVVACEDTRRTGRLLAHLGISGTRLLRVDEHDEAARSEEIVGRIAAGERVALVTDAGMPAISDPGEVLVRAVADAGGEITVVPGPSAGLAALAVSGFTAARHVFEGFLPRRGGARRERLAELADERRTIVVYESPHRIERTVADLAEVFGPARRVLVARELTKLHEELWRGSLAGAVDHLSGREARGEFVLVIEGAPLPEPATDQAILAALGEARAEGATTRDAVAEVAAELRVARGRVYDLAVGSGQ